MFFDTHIHLDDPKFDADRHEVIEKIKNSGVSYLVNVGCDVPTSELSVKLAEQHSFIYAAIGFHPCDTSRATEEGIDAIKALAAHKKVVAIGEIGLDYYWDSVPRETQKFWFNRQLDLAKELDLPVIIHNRDAHKDIYDILSRNFVKSIIHCCSCSKEMTEEFVKLGCYISFAGPITYKNNVKSVEAASVVPLDRLLIETDAPYLAPDGFRGKRNDSSLIIHTCQKLADLRGVSLDEMAKITTDNAKRIYNI